MAVRQEARQSLAERAFLGRLGAASFRRCFDAASLASRRAASSASMAGTRAEAALFWAGVPLRCNRALAPLAPCRRGGRLGADAVAEAPAEPVLGAAGREVLAADPAGEAP